MNYIINVIREDEKNIERLSVKNDENLMKILTQKKLIDFPCHGNGTCGKCKIKINEKIDYLEDELKLLSEEDIKNNVHLACKMKLDKDINILLNKERKFKILSSVDTTNIELKPLIQSSFYSYGIALDIGTTTLVMYLYNLKNGKLVDIESKINNQRNWGYDVISRINHANTNEGLKDLNTSIINQISNMIFDLSKKNNIDLDNVLHGVFVGNTTMLHLLLCEDVSTLGKAPFTPKFLEQVNRNALEMGINILKKCNITIINGMSTFLGADLVSGIIDISIDQDNDINLLIDIGTNGEIILGNKEKIYGCATAAGPAFEATNISCGVGSIEGAICRVYKKEGKLNYQTIGDKAPIGICGTGLIDIISYMLENNIIDETGYLEDDFVLCKDENGNEIKITPKDIREIQLAKSAIRAGIETLIYRTNNTLSDITNIYVAGGFGSYLNIESAIRIGLLPNKKEKIRAIGNSAGRGACKMLLNKNYIERANLINNSFECIELSSDHVFMENYIENMIF